MADLRAGSKKKRRGENNVRRESYGSADAPIAEPRREGSRVIPSARGASKRNLFNGAEAPVTNLPLHPLCLAQVRIADQHAEPRLEGRDLCAAVVGRDIVDGDTAILAEALVRDLRHPLEGAVASAEEHVGGPVVGKVLAEGACRARRLLARVVLARWHAGVERVSANYLVHVRRPDQAGIYQRIQPLDD